VPFWAQLRIGVVERDAYQCDGRARICVCDSCHEHREGGFRSVCGKNFRGAESDRSVRRSPSFVQPEDKLVVGHKAHAVGRAREVVMALMYGGKSKSSGCNR
jgi:hypothetical protein